MYELHKVTLGAVSVGLVLLLTCRTSELQHCPLVPSVGNRPTQARLLTSRQATVPVIQAWHPSPFDRARQQKKGHATVPMRYERAITTETGNDLIDWISGANAGRKLPLDGKWVLASECPQIGQTVLHRKARM